MIETMNGARPRRLADVEDRIQAERQRRTRPVVVVHGAEALRTEALEWLYGIWNRATAPARFLPVMLRGPDILRTVLGRPRLGTFHSCVFIWHRLNSSADGRGRVLPSPYMGRVGRLGSDEGKQAAVALAGRAREVGHAPDGTQPRRTRKALG
ncbi:hypothetical protein [Streptomyces lutosisoli]|uniref:Uncharacterized protein n=1 Tax=Streptomyces lutosisoli TaxID=2665721 RepID=A0ABW2VTY6_9ACTN